MKIKGEIEDLKILKSLEKKNKKKKRRKNNQTTASTTTKKENDRKNSKDISGTFSGVVGSVGSLPRWFPLFSFFCLLTSSVYDFRPDTRGAEVDTFFFFFFRLTCSVVLWGGRDAANK